MPRRRDPKYPICCAACLATMDKTGPDEWTCPKCGNIAVREDPYDNDSIYFEHTYEDEDFVAALSDDYDEVYEGKPEGCAACGNPFYPNCMNSCALCSD